MKKLFIAENNVINFIRNYLLLLLTQTDFEFSLEENMNFYTLKILNLILILFLFNSCMTNQPHAKSHHTGDGFKNTNPKFVELGLGSLLKWMNSRWKVEHSIDPNDYPAFPVLNNDGGLLRENNSKLSVTWVGHATTLIQMDGVSILTDPIWSDRCSPVSFAGPKRFTPPGIQLENLPNIDVVIISHNHYDHMDLPTLLDLEKKFHPTFIVGLGNRESLLKEGLGFVIELDWWENTKIKEVSIYFTPAQHFTGRGIFDRFETLWGSYVIEGRREKVYFAGDTGYSPHFKEIAEKFGKLDIAILPIGAFEPRWFMAGVHVDPEQAVQAFEDLQAKNFIPMHYMTFVLSDEKLDSPIPLTIQAFQAKRMELSRLIALKIGESRFF